MIHHPISIKSLGLCFPQKICFSGFSEQVHYGKRIAIMGRNGSGKSMLLKMLQGLTVPSDGTIRIPEDVSFGYVPQVIEEYVDLSGGQRLNEALTKALALDPNVLLLDEPTNHLDLVNRQSLMSYLRKYPGTLIVVTHDVDLLRHCVDTLWHIDQGKITTFAGNYDDYMREVRKNRSVIENELRLLNGQKKQTHKDLMREQARAKKSKIRGEKKREQGHWPTLVAGGKERQAQETTGRNKKFIDAKKQDLIEKLAQMRGPDIIIPRFSLRASEVNPSKIIVSIKEGCCGYDAPLLEGIFLSVGACERLAITGDNGTGKSTLMHAILNEEKVIKSGDWIVPTRKYIGYLDQHYMTLDRKKTVLETIEELVPNWSHGEIRCHLNDFLFRANEEVSALVSTLSGGEKARLSLAQLAAKTPKLLILDEITNNLDLETRNHVIQVLQHYPGAMMVISHDVNFLKEIGVKDFYDLGSKEENK